MITFESPFLDHLYEIYEVAERYMKSCLIFLLFSIHFLLPLFIYIFVLVLIKYLGGNRSLNEDLDIYAELNSRMNVSRYLLILAVNSILENGDYSDEIYWFERPIEQRTPKTQHSWLLDMMNWDLARIQEPCHSTEYLQNKFTFCAQSILDYVLLRNPAASETYLSILHNLLLESFENHVALSVSYALQDFSAALNCSSKNMWHRRSILAQTLVSDMTFEQIWKSSELIQQRVSKRASYLLQELALRRNHQLKVDAPIPPFSAPDRIRKELTQLHHKIES